MSCRVPVPEMPPKALGTLAFLWIVAECETAKGRRRAAMVREMALRCAHMSRVQEIRGAAPNPEAAALCERIAALVEAAEQYAAERG